MAAGHQRIGMISTQGTLPLRKRVLVDADRTV
jgi:hypothetical protein